ncbi:MAG: hypothetical protein R3E79_39640 [Caldilineaceae bacterium]
MAYVTDIAVVAGSAYANSQWASPGSGWEVVRNKYGEPQDFNQHALGEFIWMFYKTADSGPGIAAVRFIPGKDAVAPPGWTKINVDFNKGAGGEHIWLFYVKDEETKYIARFQSGYGESETSAWDDFEQSAVVLRMDTNEGVSNEINIPHTSLSIPQFQKKYCIFLGYYYI